MAASKTKQPFIHYHCPCIVARVVPGANSPSAILYTPVRNPQAEPVRDFDVEETPSAASFSAHPISQLYFCEDCNRIKCTRCLQDDIICYYCPNCLFEVPTASVKGEKNRCMRNCFQCPSCYNTLTVITGEVPATTTAKQATGTAAAAAAAAPASTAVYYLSCSTCRWDSREINLTFERPTGLAAQIQKIEDNRHEVREFEHLKEHFERIMRNNMANNPGTGYASLFSNLASINMHPLRSQVSPTTATAPDNDDIDETTGDPLYKPLPLSQELEDDESRQVEEAMTLTDADQVPTLRQRHSHPNEQPFNVSALHPERIHLRVKRLKRCRSCKQVLIKPDQKAIHYIPTITIAQMAPLRVGESGNIVLRFANPLYFPIDVQLDLPKSDEISVVAKRFDVAEFSDVWDYDNDLSGPSSATLLAARARRDQEKLSLPEGVVAQKGSTTCIIVSVTPNAVVSEFKFPLLVKYSYFETSDSEESGDDDIGDLDDDKEKEKEKEKEEEEKSDNEENDKANEEQDTTETTDESDKPASKPKKKGELHENQFWLTVGCGPVLDAVVPTVDEQ
ncbi:dynactin p62 family-domain-containing protein [Syncephalis plumigaleata]|nr:dynactin p62 family-domain-containing protein [Syncephalis plumigaleata]